MKKELIYITFLLVFCFSTTYAESSGLGKSKFRSDSSQTRDKIAPKTGYNLAPFPEFMIDPSVGVYFGINATLFDFGDGTNYPNYNKLINLNAAWGTKGKTNLSLRYKQYGKYVLSAEVGHSIANLQPFYGFNGYQTRYSQNIEDPTSQEYISSAFYNYYQKKSLVNFYFQDNVVESPFGWQAGFEISHYTIGRVDFGKLNSRTTESLNYNDDTITLYDLYKEWNLISEVEENGGWANSIRVALLFDTRNNLTNPDKGFWTQVTARYFPALFGNYQSGLQMSIKYQHYYKLIANRLSFAYRIRFDATFGNFSYYHRHVLADGIEGYGGANGKAGEGFGTIWGIKQNRVIGKQMALANFELRAKLFQTRILNQNWQLAAVPIYHTGLILQPYNLNLSQVSDDDKQKFFTSSYKGWYHSFGIGAKIVMNDNIVIGLDWAVPLNPEAGNHSLYIGLGYTF